jgi:hypothetical protein
MNLSSILTVILVGGGILLLLGVVFASVWGFVRWRGAWRAAALLPLAGVVFVGASIVFDTRRDPTSHNLWPLEVLIAGLVGLFMLTLFFFGQRAGGTHRDTP